MKKLPICAALFLFVAQLVFCQGKAAGIDTTEVIDIGGIKQVIRITGNDPSMPLLLYVHGAGATNYSLIANADKLTSRLREHFVVVLWDQREYGKTVLLNKSPQALGVKLLVDDTKELVDYLLKRFHRQKLYLVGHSMGCVMGIYMAQQYPALLNALVEVSPPVDGIKSQEIAVAMLKKHFKQLNNQQAVKELAAIRLPARDFESLFIKVIWQSEYDGKHISDTARAQLKPILREWMQSPAAALSNEVFEMNFGKQFPELQCPVYFFVGRKDYVTNATLSQKYYQKLRAPLKQLFWFEKSAHNIPDTEPELMQDIIITKILPNTQP